MDKMPLIALFLQSMPEEFIVITLGLLLVGYRPRVLKVAIAAVVSAVISYFVRALPIPFGIHTIIMVVVMAGLVWVILKVNWRVAVVGVLVGATLLALAEGISIPLMVSLTGIPMEQVMASTWLRIIFPWPHMAVLAVLALCCWRFDWALIRLGSDQDKGLPF